MNRGSIKSACESLEAAPSYHGVYTTLKDEVLSGHALDSVERHTHEGLKAAFPKRMTQRGQKVAIDWVLIPYSGDEATLGMYRSQAKKSTPTFFGYASASLIKKHKRIPLHFTLVRETDTLLDVLKRVLNEVKALDIRVKRFYLSRGFAS